jgi:hypothetical protein
MKRAYVEKARTWEEFKLGLPGNYTAVVNRYLDGIVRNKDRPLGQRFDALLHRTSWGNFSDFACSRVPKSQDPREPEASHERVLLKPLTQVEFARILKVDFRRVQELVQLRQDQGLMARREDLDNPGLLMPLYDPQEPRERKKEPASVAWPAFSTAWDSQHPDLVQKVKEYEEAAKPYLVEIEAIRKRKLSDWKTAQKVPNTAEPSTPEHSGRTLRNTPERSSGTPRSPKTSNPPISNDLDSKVEGQTLNIKEEELYKESIPSVGRSSSSMGSPPTDRPTDESSPYKEKVREWLESSFKLPMAIEDPELGQIADTVKTDAHLKQFQEAALRQKDPRGWKVFVTIARNAQKHQDKYSTAAAGGEEAKKEDPLVKRMREEAERKKSWPTY